MTSYPQPDYRSKQLDLSLLSTPFQVQTRWHVITGAPCSGKSTLVNLLALRGFRIVPESARLYIERVMAQGQANHPIRADAAALQRGIKAMQMEVESGLPAQETLFLDGAVPGSLAWCRIYGVDPNEILADCFRRRYASVFVLAPLPFQADDERIEEMLSIASFLDEWQTRDYTSLGYNVVRVPVLPPEERLAFVLAELNRHAAGSEPAAQTSPPALPPAL